MTRVNDDLISSRFKFTSSQHIRSSYSKYGSFSATATESRSFSTNTPLIKSIHRSIGRTQTIDVCPLDDPSREPSDPRPYKRRKLTTNRTILAPILINAQPIDSMLSPSAYTMGQIHTSRTRSPSMMSLKRFKSRQTIRYKSVPTRSHSVDACQYRSTHAPPIQTLQKIEIMRSKSPAPHLEIALNSRSLKTKLKARKLPIKPIQMDFIYVIPNGIRYFCRSLSPSQRLSDSIQCLELNLQNPKVIYNKELLAGDPLISNLDENMKLIVYDDINDEHKAENMDKRTRLQIQTILYQSITGLPNAVSLFVVELARLGRFNCSKAWDVILPTNQYPNIKQKYKNERLDQVVAGKLCAVDVLSPFTFGKTKVTVSIDDNIANLKKMIQRKKKFKCKELLLFAATQRGPISMMNEGNDGIYCIHDEDEDESMHEMDSDWEGSMSAIDDFMFNLDDYDAGWDVNVERTLNTYWIHAELKQRLRYTLKQHSMENLQFFQLRDEDVQLCQLPLHFIPMKRSVVSMKTFVYIVPLPSNPYSLRNDKSKLKEIYEWCVGPIIASELLITNPVTETRHQEEEERKHEVMIHFEGVEDAYDTMNIFISESQTVGAFIQKIKALKREYRYKNVDVYVYDEALGEMDTLPLSTRSVLYHSIRSYDNTLHIVIKTQPMVKRRAKVPMDAPRKGKKRKKPHRRRQSLKQKFSDFVSSNEKSHHKRKRTKRAKSTSQVGRTQTIYDPAMIYGAGTPIDDKVIAELNNMSKNKKRSKSSGITRSTQKKKALRGFIRTKRKNVKRPRKRRYVFNDD